MTTEITLVLLGLLISNHVFVILLPYIYRLVLPAGQELRGYAVEHDADQTRREWISSLVTTPVPPLILAASILLGLWRPDTATETWWSIAATFLAVFIWSEIWHYYSHVLMHSRRWIWIHRHHHVSQLPRAMSCLSFSIVEKTLQSLGILAPIWLTAIYWQPSFYGVIAYYLLYFYTNAMGHYNLEPMPAGYTRTLFGSIFTAPTYHIIHHARYTGNFGLMTTFLDKLHGTYWGDYPDVLDRAATGQPLPRLNTRLDRQTAA